MNRGMGQMMASLALAALGGCGSGRGDNLVTFSGSACKKENTTSSTQQALLTTLPSENFAGLKCIVWKRVEPDRLQVDLVNFEGACGAKWKGEALLDGTGGLALRVTNPGCLVASCGWCIYDWSFEVSGVSGQTDMPLSITRDTCPGQQPSETAQASVPLATQAQGVLCRPANWSALGWQAMATSTCGTAGMPCLGTMVCPTGASTSTPQTCATGLTCADNGNPSELVCLRPCAADADCAASGILSCQAGLCRPANPW